MLALEFDIAVQNPDIGIRNQMSQGFWTVYSWIHAEMLAFFATLNRELVLFPLGFKPTVQG